MVEEKSDSADSLTTPAPPRTVKRRVSRRVVPSRSAQAPSTKSENAEIRKSAEKTKTSDKPKSAEKPKSSVKKASGKTSRTSTPTVSTADEPSKIETEPVGADAGEAEAAEATEAKTTGAETIGAEQPGSPAGTSAAQPRTGRIEIPVPSVQRARERGAVAAQNPVVLRTEALTKTYGEVLAATEVSISVHAGSFTGIVGPNGAGKTTVLSMISGLNRPTSGRITVRDTDVWEDGPKAKRLIGTLPDRLRLFDRLTGAQLLYYAGILQGVESGVVAKRAKELAEAFGLESALDRLVSDYSAGMQKKIGLACSMIHAPDVLVLDEPFEAIDPVSASNVTDILEKFVAGGGSVIMSSHSLDLIQRVCDHVAVIVDGTVIAQGTVDAVRDGLSLEERFRHLTRPDETGEGLEWLHGFADSE